MMASDGATTRNRRVVDQDDWLAARLELLTAEKEFTRRRDALTRARRELPWERIEKEYAFATPSGEQTLSELFAGRSQAIYRTYSTYGRGIDLLNTTYNYLDLVPLGRGEEGQPVQYWVRRHDEYGDQPTRHVSRA